MENSQRVLLENLSWIVSMNPPRFSSIFLQYVIRSGILSKIRPEVPRRIRPENRPWISSEVPQESLWNVF